MSSKLNCSKPEEEQVKFTRPDEQELPDDKSSYEELINALRHDATKYLIESLPASPKKSKSRLISLDDEVVEPPMVFSLVEEGEERIICTQGNLSLVIGKAKSKKTYFIKMLVSILISHDAHPTIKVNSELKKSVSLYFDTEQSRYHVRNALDQMFRLSGLQKEEFSKRIELYALRSDSIKDRIEIINEVINDKQEKIGLIVIDGIRDLVSEINNEKEANEIVSLIMELSEKHQTHIVLVLHQNKGDNNARGHLGTELVNKAETIISITKERSDPTISIIECEQSRNAHFMPFAIQINGEGLPEILSNCKHASRTKKYNQPGQFTHDEHMEVLKKVFSVNSILSSNKLNTMLYQEYERMGKKIGQTKIREFVAYYEQEGYIVNQALGNNKKEFILNKSPVQSS